MSNCPFNEQVKCSKVPGPTNCKNCGFNPAEVKRRTKVICEQRKKEKAAAKKTPVKKTAAMLFLEAGYKADPECKTGACFKNEKKNWTISIAPNGYCESLAKGKISGLTGKEIIALFKYYEENELL